jgi:hypothetical protein
MQGDEKIASGSLKSMLAEDECLPSAFNKELKKGLEFLQAIVVGDQEFPFKSSDESCCDLLRLPADSDDLPAEEVAQIRQKLHIQVH